MYDPQTSGGLLAAVGPGAVEQVLAAFDAAGAEAGIREAINLKIKLEVVWEQYRKRVRWRIIPGIY